MIRVNCDRGGCLVTRDVDALTYRDTSGGPIPDFDAIRQRVKDAGWIVVEHGYTVELFCSWRHAGEQAADRATRRLPADERVVSG